MRRARTPFALLAIAIAAAQSSSAFAQNISASVPPGNLLVFAGLSYDRAEADALRNAPDVAGARAVVDQNAALLAAARGALGPSIVGGYTLAPQGGNNNNTIASRQTMVGVQTTLGDYLSFSPLVAAATATLRSARANVETALRLERVKVAGLYYDALKARAVRGARDSALQLASDQRNAAQLRFKAGDAPRLDVVRAQVAVAKATVDDENARAVDANATEALRVETASVDSLAQTIAQPIPPVAPTPLGPEAALMQARLLRPELAAASATTAAARDSRRAALRAAFPAVTLGAGYSRGEDSGVQVAGPTINISVNVPLSGVARAKAAEQAAIVAEAAAKQQSAERTIIVEVGAAARTLAAAGRASAASTEARTQAAQELRATELGYRNGASTSLELTIARDTYAVAVVDELSTLYDEAKARATLAIEVGK